MVVDTWQNIGLSTKQNGRCLEGDSNTLEGHLQRYRSKHLAMERFTEPFSASVSVTAMRVVIDIFLIVLAHFYWNWNYRRRPDRFVYG